MQMMLGPPGSAAICSSAERGGRVVTGAGDRPASDWPTGRLPRASRDPVDGATLVDKVVGTAPPKGAIEVMDGALLCVDGKAVLDVGYGPCLAVARGVVEGEAGEGQVEEPVAPAGPAIRRVVGLAEGSGFGQVDGDIGDEVGVGEMGGEAGTELVGVHPGMMQVVRGDLAELGVVDVQGAVGDVEVIEVATFAALREGTELRRDQLGRLKGEHVGGAGPPVGIDSEVPSLESNCRGHVVEVDLPLEPPQRSVDADVGEAFSEPVPGGRGM